MFVKDTLFPIGVIIKPRKIHKLVVLRSNIRIRGQNKIFANVFTVKVYT